jgi:hypothetical protein
MVGITTDDQTDQGTGNISLAILLVMAMTEGMGFG